jgi:hypothetical protein
MPTIPNMTLASNAIDATEIYQNGLYAPANPPTSAEVLNGGLEQANYDGAAGSIKPYMMDMGTFARGYSASFSRREFVYAKQLDENFEEFTISACAISTRLFLPFEARVIQYGWQCWFNHDASSYYTGGSSFIGHEFWQYKLDLWSKSTSAVLTASQSLTGRLPYGREKVGGTWNENNGVMEEARWYYVSKTGMLSGNFTKGYYDLSLQLSARLFTPSSSSIVDGSIAKNKLMSGTIWVLALR